MKKLSKAINLLSKLAEIPVYNKCKNCGDADPYLSDDGLCYKCFDPTLKNPLKSQKNINISSNCLAIMKQNDLIPYATNPFIADVVCILPPYNIINGAKTSKPQTIDDAKIIYDKADPKLIEQIYNTHDFDYTIRKYLITYNRKTENNKVRLWLRGRHSKSKIVCQEWIFDKDQLMAAKDIKDLELLGVPEWFIKLHTKAFGSNVDLIKDDLLM